MSFNIRSAFNKIDQLEQMLFEENPTILCLQETWLSRDKNKHFKIDSNNKVHIVDNFRTKRVGGEVAIFVSSNSGLGYL